MNSAAQSSGICVAGVFARAPVAGHTKTRLIPALGPEGAAALHSCMLLDTLDRVTAAGIDAVTFLAPARARRQLQDLGVAGRIEGQGGGDLGARMARALGNLTSRRGVDRAFLIGTDSPDLPVPLLREAARRLRKSPVILAPSHDGGFTLIGCRAAIDLRRPLRGVNWSSSIALEQTVRRLCDAGLEPALLPVWWDVDEPSDLDLLRSRLAMMERLGRVTPVRTAQFLGIARRHGPKT